MFYKFDDVVLLVLYLFEDLMVGLKLKFGIIYLLSVEENDNEKFVVYLLKYCEE